MRNYFFINIALILIFAAFHKLSFGQGTTIINEDTPYEITFKYTQPEDSKSQSLNYIIKEIAQANQKRLEFTSFSLSYLFSNKFIKIDTVNYTLNSELKNLKLKGDIFFRNLNISQVLIPAEIDYTVKISRKKQSTLNINGQENYVIVFEQPIKSQKLIDNLGYFQFQSIAFKDTVNDAQYKIEVKNPVLYFNETSKTNFNRHISLINDYYETEPMLEAQMIKINKMESSNIDLISFYEVELREVENVIKNIELMQFPQQLKLFESDPIHFIQKMQELKMASIQKRTELNQRIKILDQLFCQKGNDFLQQGKLAEARIYYNKSVQVNPFYTPAQYQLALMEYNAGNIDTAATMINAALQKASSDNETKNLLIELGNKVYNSLMEIGNKYNSEEKYNEAIDELSRAENLCKNTPGLKCSEQLSKSIAQAHYGIYKSYLKVAEKSIEHGRLDIAHVYIKHSLEYQKKHQSEIISNSESIYWTRILCEEYVKLGNLLNKQNKFKEALVKFNKCDSISKTDSSIGEIKGCSSGVIFAHNGIYNEIVAAAKNYFDKELFEFAEKKCLEAMEYQAKNATFINNNKESLSVLAKVKEKYYHAEIEKGKNQLSRNDYDNALESFLQAAKYEKEYSFNVDDSLTYFLRISGKPKIMKDIEAGKLQAWGNKLDEANITLQKVKKDIIDYRLGGDKEISDQVKDFEAKIFDKNCYNEEQKFLNNLNEANKQIRMGNYEYAYEILSKAAERNLTDINCNIDKDKALKEKERIKPVINFLAMMRTADEYAANKNYTQSIQQIELSEVFYNTNRIDTFGLSSPSILKYISTSPDVNFIYFGVEYLYKLKNYDAAFTLLKELQSRSYPQKYTKTIQKQLGIKMAVKDKIAGIENYKIQLLKYTEGEKWYSVFYKTYKQTWKKN